MTEIKSSEECLLGCLMQNPEQIADCYDSISCEMFSDDVLGRIYKEYQRGYDNNYDVTPQLLSQKITEYDSSILLDAIKNCMIAYEFGATVDRYVDLIVNEYKSRVFNNILNHIQVSADCVEEQIGEMITSLESLLENRQQSSKTLSEIASEYKDSYFKEQTYDKMLLGFSKLDDMIGGLEGGDVIVIGARPAVGKSAFVTQIANHISHFGKKVAYYNLEMQDRQMYERFVVNASGISLTRLKRASNFLGDEKERFENANRRLSERDNLFIYTGGGKTVSQIRNECRHMDFDVIIIDYLQLIRSDSTYRGNRTAEVGQISKAIKSLAMELNIPIILLSQLNRASEMNQIHEPSMSELRESGDIEQDASIVILLWNADEDRVFKGCKIEKNRQGETGKTMLKFRGEVMRFEETRERPQQVQNAKRTSETWKSNDDNPFD